MDLISLESWATFFRWAIVLFGLGSSTAGLLGFYYRQKDETKQSGYQVAGIILGLFVVGAAALNFGFTARVASTKDETFQRFKSEKDTEIRNLEHGNLGLQKEIANLEKNNLTFRSKVAAIETEADQQRERAAKAEKDLFEVQERLKPRRLTFSQRSRLQRYLSGIGKGEIEIIFINGNSEAENLAVDIATALQSAGWKVSGLNGSIFVGGGTPTGLRLVAREAQDPKIIGILFAFKDIGIPLPLKVNAKANPPVQLLVGNKP
jgi:hypothetical protein